MEQALVSWNAMGLNVAAYFLGIIRSMLPLLAVILSAASAIALFTHILTTITHGKEPLERGGNKAGSNYYDNDGGFL